MVAALLQQTNLYEHRHKPLGSFSGGMKQRFGIAQALLGNPRLLIVDEPTAGLDPEDRMRFHNLLSSIGENVIVILSYAFKGPPYPVSLDLIDFLKQVTPPEYQYLYEDMWQSITLYENHAKSATASRQPDASIKCGWW